MNSTELQMRWRAYEDSDRLVKSFNEFAVVAESCLVAIRSERAGIHAESVTRLIDQITERIKEYLDELEKQNLENSTGAKQKTLEQPNSGERARILQEIRTIAQGSLPYHRADHSGSISEYALDAILNSDLKSYSIITFEGCDQKADLDELLRNVTVLDHDSPLAIAALKRMSAALQQDPVPGKRRILGRTAISPELSEKIEKIRRTSPNGRISFSKLRQTLDEVQQQALATAATNAWLRLRLAWRVFDDIRDNLGSSTVSAFERRNISYHLIRDILMFAWNSSWGNPEGARAIGRRVVQNDKAKLRELLVYMFDCIDQVVTALPSGVASGLREPLRVKNRKEAEDSKFGDEYINQRRSELVLHVMRQRASLSVLTGYRVWLHAFVEVSSAFCKNDISRKDRQIVLSRIFGELIVWGREVEACLLTGDDRPRERRLGPAGVPASTRRQLSRRALESKLVWVDIPVYGRGLTPDAVVLTEIVSACCAGEVTALAAWDRLRQLVPADFLNQVPGMVA